MQAIQKPLYTFTFLLITLYSVFSQAALPIADSQNQALPTLAPLVQQVSPAVVNISVKATVQTNNPLLNDPNFRHFFNIPDNYQQQRKSKSAGSGVIIDATKGIIITNHHVIKGADEISIGLNDGRNFIAKLIGSDPEVDVAVLKIEASDLIDIPLADSKDLHIGDFVIAVGNPFGLGQTITTGIVSALGRTGLGIEGYENFIQTDASINPGNSGGALVNLRGELVGINTAILAPTGGNIGIGFAIPTNMAMASHEQILEHGEVQRGRLGIFIQDLTPELAHAFNVDKNQKGIVVTKVQKNSPAKSAGIKAEDIIIKINDEAVDNSAELRNQIGLRRLGETVKVTLLRNNKTKHIKVSIEDIDQLYTDKTEHETNTQLKALDGATLSNSEQGVVITNIERASVAAKAGLQVGDIILSANRKNTTTIKALKKAIKSNDREVLLRIMRDSTVFFLLLR